MEDCVVEIGVRVAASSGPQETLPLLAAQEGDVFNQVRHALLMWLLVHAPYKPMTHERSRGGNGRFHVFKDTTSLKAPHFETFNAPYHRMTAGRLQTQSLKRSTPPQVAHPETFRILGGAISLNSVRLRALQVFPIELVVFLPLTLMIPSGRLRGYSDMHRFWHSH